MGSSIERKHGYIIDYHCREKINKHKVGMIYLLIRTKHMIDRTETSTYTRVVRMCYLGTCMHVIISSLLNDVPLDHVADEATDIARVFGGHLAAQEALHVELVDASRHVSVEVSAVGEDAESVDVFGPHGSADPTVSRHVNDAKVNVRPSHRRSGDQGKDQESAQSLDHGHA